MGATLTNYQEESLKHETKRDCERTSIKMNNSRLCESTSDRGKIQEICIYAKGIEHDGSRVHTLGQLLLLTTMHDKVNINCIFKLSW